jgi:hypothetical protein
MSDLADVNMQPGVGKAKAKQGGTCLVGKCSWPCPPQTLSRKGEAATLAGCPISAPSLPQDTKQGLHPKPLILRDAQTGLRQCIMQDLWEQAIMWVAQFPDRNASAWAWGGPLVQQ